MAQTLVRRYKSREILMAVIDFQTRADATPLPAPTAPDQETVNILEMLLQEARAGRVRDVACVYAMANGATGRCLNVGAGMLMVMIAEAGLLQRKLERDCDVWTCT